MKKIDLEHHFYDFSMIDALTRRKTYPYYDRETDTIHWTERVPMPQGKLLETLLDVSEKRVALMDRRGIDAAVLSCSPGVEQLDAGESIKVSKETNDAVYKVMQRHPGRFMGSAILPIKNVEEAVTELERCVKKYNFVAWHTHSNYGDTAPDFKEYRPIFKKAAELGIYVYLHPQLGNNERLEGFGFSMAGPGLGFTVDTIITITRIILSGMLDELPSLKIVLGHLGEGIPFLLNRMENRVKFIPNEFMKQQKSLDYYFKHNIWVSTSGNMSKEAFKCTMDVLGMDRIVLGTDYPYENLDEMMDFLDGLPLTGEEFEMLYSGNAINALGLGG